VAEKQMVVVPFEESIASLKDETQPDVTVPSSNDALGRARSRLSVRDGRLTAAKPAVAEQ